MTLLWEDTSHARIEQDITLKMSSTSANEQHDAINSKQ